MTLGKRALLRALLPLAAAAGITAGAAGTHTAVSSTLYAGFDADGNIRLTYADGTMIGTPSPPGTLVPAGTYTINLNNNGLDDAGGMHVFHLFGPGVNLSAGNNLYDTTVWTATFQPSSTYVYQDDNNPTTIHEVFGTPGSGAGTGTTSPPTTVAAPPGAAGGKKSKPASQDIVGSAYVPLRGTLVGTVGATGALKLTWDGKPVTSLKAGRYTFRVTDSSKKAGFTVQEIKNDAVTVTTSPFTGTRSKTLNLKAGQWFFYPSFIGKKTYFIVTA
jgi:hypothetical protein